MDYFQIIKDTELFKNIQEEILKDYFNRKVFKIRQYTKNSVLHFESELCNNLEVILSGKITIDRIDESGGLMTVTEFYTGDILGGNLLFSKSPFYPMTITSQTESVILEIDKSTLFNLLCENRNFLSVYLEYISDHTFILSDKIKNYVNKSIRDSLLKYFEYERNAQNSNKIKLDISKKQLADRFGVQRTSLSRELCKMRNEGLIKYDTKTVELLY